MYQEHEAGKKRKLDTVSSDPAVETDEQLARRLHEELNALTRHARRSNAPAFTGLNTQRSGGKAGKTAAAGPDGKPAAGRPSKQQQTAAATTEKQQPSHAEVKQEDAGADGQEEQPAANGRADKPRKRSMLNRELAMLVTDMVESHVKPVTGGRAKSKDEQDQQDQQQQQDDNQSAAVKHESSSSLSEQERLAIEHLHAAVTEGKPVNKLLTVPHLTLRTSDSGGAGGDSCTTGATSSGKAVSSSGREHDQQQTSSQQRQQQQPSKQLQRTGTVTSTAAAAALAHAGSGPAGSTADCAGSKPMKIPKLPMVQYGKKWYRAKVMKDAGSKVMLEYQGFSHEGGPFWLAKDHPRIWRGSYKGRDWRYLGDGAWEPKQDKQDAKPRSYRAKSHHHRHAAGAAAGAGSDGGAGMDSDAEQLQQYKRGPRRSAAAAAAAAPAGTASRDTDQEDTDQEEDEGDDLPREHLTADSPSVVPAEAKQQPVPEPEQQKPQEQEQQQEQQEQQQQQQQQQQPAEQQRRSDSEADAAAVQASPAVAKGSKTAAAAAAAAAAAVPGDSSSERQAGDPAGVLTKGTEAADKAEEAGSAPGRATGRGRHTRSRAGSKTAREDGDTTAQPPSKRRPGRSRSAAAAQSESQGQQEQQQQGSGAKEQLVLQIDASRALKHSSSSEGLPMSPTSPVAGGSPRHRRKGKPQRARLGDDSELHQPAKKGRGSAATSSKSAAALARSNSDAAEGLDLHLTQPEPLQLQQAEQQQPQPQLHLGFKGGWKAAKKGMWNHGQQQQQQQERHSTSQHHPAPQQQQDSKAHEHDRHWGEQQQQQQQEGQGHMHAEQQPHMLGSDPDDVEAACVLVGASMGRAHSAELVGMYGSMHSSQQASFQHRYSAGAEYDSQLSPRGYTGRQNGRRQRGHNWSKPVHRPPRPPAQQQQQQHAGSLARRHSLNNSSSQQQVQQHQQQQQGLYAGSAELCIHTNNHSVSQEGLCGGSGAGGAAAAASPGMSRQTSLQSPAAAACGQPQPPVQQQLQQQQHKNGSCLLFGNTSTLRTLLDAVGEVQASSSRPDLIDPLRYGGLPMGTEQPQQPSRTCSAALQLPHVHVSAAAAALLAAVPSLEALQHMAAVQGQAGLVACLNGHSPSLFQ